MAFTNIRHAMHSLSSMRSSQRHGLSVPRTHSLPRPLPVPRRSRVVISAQKDGYKVIVVGGGCAGSAVAAHYGRKFGQQQVAVIESSGVHYYQPLFTLVGGGFRSIEDAAKPEAEVLPKNATWLQTSVTHFDPDSNTVTTADGRTLRYDYLVVATGMHPDWASVKGLPEALGDGHVVSNYSPQYAPMTYEVLRKLKHGNAIFTMPKDPVKCPGAGHKACWLSEDYLRRKGRRPDVAVTYVTPSAKVLGLQRYLTTIEQVVKERDILVVPNTLLVEVRRQQQEAVFQTLSPDGQPTGEQVRHYDMLHVTPAHVPATAVAGSSLANSSGWVDVDKYTLQHVRYGNVFAIGDCAAVPTGKTAAAAAAQFLVLRDNLDALMAGQLQQETAAKYDGYASCPVVTGKGKVMLMEFGYDSQIMEMFTKFGIDQSKEQYVMWLVKTLILPPAYWHLLTKGFVPWRELPRMLQKAAAALTAATADAAPTTTQDVIFQGREQQQHSQQQQQQQQPAGMHQGGRNAHC